MAKTIRNLSGIYFRHQLESGRWDNITFEDLPEDKQDEILSTYTKEQTNQLCKLLAKTLNNIGDQIDIIMD